MAVSAVAAVVSLGFSMALGEDRFAHKQSRVVLTSGPPLCGEILVNDAKTIVVKLKDTGKLRVLPLAHTRAIKDDAC